ncbi:UNVERIFIED_CONTAM: hypothetical protein GTU68_030342 [Idotea baltica]|nr:hypothetical protein [Idotea baltica]
MTSRFAVQTPIELREKFSVPVERYRDFLSSFSSRFPTEEAVLLSTCNRTELVTASSFDDPQLAPEQAVELFSELSGLTPSICRSHMYFHADTNAIAHVFRLASGLDSLVVGEPQILGQLKEAYRHAHGAGYTRVYLNRLFERAFAVAKTVRSSTEIGSGAVSISYAAKELAAEIFGDLQQSTVLLLGAGETGALAAKHFQRVGAKKIYVANRTLARAVSLAESLGAFPLSLGSAGKVLAEADIVVGACSIESGDTYLLSREQMQQSLSERRRRPQILLDLGVPRNFDADIASLEDVYSYSVDDLEAVASENLQLREKERSRAEVLVEESIELFSAWLETRKLVPMILEAKERLEKFEENELQRTLKRLAKEGFSAEQTLVLEEALRGYSAGLLGKVLHRPLTAIKSNSSDFLLESFAEMFAPPREEEEDKS